MRLLNIMTLARVDDDHLLTEAAVDLRGQLTTSGRTGSIPWSKRALDLAIAIPGSIALLPLLAWTAAAMRLTHDDGPILYGSWRVGQGGRLFRVYKLRSMRMGADGPGITTMGDPRLTRLGAILRRTKIDELPQLWNVVRGEMSMVGPRPEDPRYVDWRDQLHAEVFSGRPGITGPAQIRFRREELMLAGEDAEAFYTRRVLPAKLALDAAYLRSQSVAGDLRILAETARALFKSSAQPADPFPDLQGVAQTVEPVRPGDPT